MNIFLHELKDYRKSLLLWTLALAAIALLFLSFYPSISKDIEEFTKLLEGFPEPVRQAFGIQLDRIGSVLGFYSYLFLYILLCGAIQGMNLGVSILSKEAREKTADFLLTKPVSRTKIVTAKLMAAVVSLLITNAVYLIVVSLTAAQVSTEAYSSTVLLLISLTLLFVQLIFLSIGLAISVLVPKIKSVLTVTLGTVFAFFFLGMITSIGGDGAKRFLSPFQYFDRNYIMDHASYEIPYVIAGAAIVAATVIVSYVVYLKKDIHTV